MRPILPSGHIRTRSVHSPNSCSKIGTSPLGRDLSAGRSLRAIGGVTMSLHKLTAGHGYDYLVRQVAALDATHGGRTGLAGYYTGRGETPERWVGRGLNVVDGLEAGMW